MLRLLAIVLGCLVSSGCLTPSEVAAQGRLPACDRDNAGLTLPPGFCALVVADNVGPARHLTVAPSGDVFVALRETRQGGQVTRPGGVLVLRDTDGDGKADVQRRFASGAGDDVEFYRGYLYYSTNDAVMRFPWREREMEPAGPVDTIVKGLPARAHPAKSLAFGPDNELYVNIGSPSNSCQQADRVAGSPGKDPCEELESRAGIWRFEANRRHQTQQDGRRFATGLRHSVALAIRPQDGELYAVVHGRDQLFQNWSSVGYDEEAGAEKPAEEFVRIREGDDFGWPYCYYDAQLKLKVLAPEYGGDGRTVGRCRDKKDPLIALPAHWAPNGLVFYQGRQFPERYRGGAFIAFHGSWNRAPLPQGGYNVVFVPFEGNQPTGEWEVFADGFAGANKDPRQAAHRPCGIAEGPDGSLYVSDDQGGRIYRILYQGGR
jgi:glucose/arabinose dehydrogenase